MAKFEDLLKRADEKGITLKKAPEKKALPKPDFRAGLKDIGERRGTEVLKSLKGFGRGEQSLIETIGQVGSQVAAGAVDVPIEAIRTGFRALPDVIEQPLRQAGAAGVRGIASLPGVTPAITKASEAWEGLKAQDTRSSRNITGLLTGVGTAADVLGARAVTAPVKAGAKQTLKGVAKAKEAVEQAIKATPAKEAAKVVKQVEELGLNKTIVPMVKRAAGETKSTMQKMLSDAARRAKDLQAAHPIERVGKILQKEADTALKGVQRVGKEITGIKQTLPKVTVDLTDAISKFRDDIAKQGIKVGQDGSIKALKLPEADKRFIGEFVQKLLPNEKGEIKRTLQSLVDLDSRIFNELDLAKANKAISAAEMPILRLRDALKSEIKKFAPNLIEKQTQYAELKKLLDPYLRTAGKGRFTDKAIKELKASRLASQLLNRFSERPQEVIDGIIKAASKFDKGNAAKKLSEIKRLSNFSDVLENVYKVAPPRSFQTQVQKGAEKAIKAAETAGDVMGAVSGNPMAVIKAAQGLFGRTKDMQAEQVKAIKKLLGL